MTEGQLMFGISGAGKEISRIAAQRPSIMTLALASDGKTLATATLDDDRTTWLSLWESVGGRKLHQWQAHNAEVHTLAFSSDGKRLASASTEGEKHARVWAVPTGKQQLEIAGEFQSVGFSPCGKVLASLTHTAVFLWDADTGKEIRQIPKGGSGLMAFSADGKGLALSNGYAINLWDTATGKRLDPSPDGHDDSVSRVMFLPDGKTLVSSSMHALYRWQLDTGKRIGRFDEIRVDLGTLSPDGKILAVSPPSENQTIELWDTEAGKKIHDLEAMKYSGYALAFSHDRKTLAAARTGLKTIQLWDVVTGKRVGQFAIDTPDPAHERAVQSLAFSPDGKTLAVGDGGLLKHPKTPKVRLLEVATGRERQKPFDVALAGKPLPLAYASPVTFSGDGKTLVASTNDGTVQVWDVVTGKVISRMEGVRSIMALSPNGKTVASAGPEGSVRLWDLATGKDRRHLRGHLGPVTSLAWSADGKTLASGSLDTTILIWPVEQD